MNTQRVSLLGLFALLIAGVNAEQTTSIQADRPLVGVNYFAGWWEEMPNKWHGHGWTAQEPDWRPLHPERVPTTGAYNVQATMDREIAAASNHGVDFFSILWYYPQPGGKRLGIPRRNGSCQPAFTIYAWNEFGEGGIVAPTQGEGAMKLEAIREVFRNK